MIQGKLSLKQECFKEYMRHLLKQADTKCDGQTDDFTPGYWIEMNVDPF